MSDKIATPKPKKNLGGTGRPKGTGTKPGKLLRVLLTPRQDRLLTQLRTENGISESEATRTALNNYFDLMEARGELIDNAKVPVAAKSPES